METRAYRDAVDRIRAEYLEMPGVRLTPPQVQWLCGIELDVCVRVLEQLAAARFLYCTDEGIYARVGARSRAVRPVMAKSTLRRSRAASRRAR
jgi:hypothetical protein